MKQKDSMGGPSVWAFGLRSSHAICSKCHFSMLKVRLCQGGIFKRNNVVACRNAYYVGTMAKATDMFQRTAMRANYLYTCSLPEFAAFEVCAPKEIARGLTLTVKNVVLAESYHQQLFLGTTKLETFKDPRLLVRICMALAGPR